MDKKNTKLANEIEMALVTAQNGALSRVELLNLLREAKDTLKSEPFDAIKDKPLVFTVSHERLDPRGEYGAFVENGTVNVYLIKEAPEPLSDGWYMADVKAKGMPHDTQEMAMKRVGDFWRDGFGCKLCDAYDISNPRRIEVSDDN